jgi:hypothetical protein
MVFQQPRAPAPSSAESAYDNWKSPPTADMISNAAVAGVLWLTAEADTDATRVFWQGAGKVGK